ncbi:MAG: NUDIX domain-containing protein [Vulcanimicrobiota bacterium]
MIDKIRIRVAVILPRDKEILLVRHVKKGRQYWLVPGGGLDPGETIEECAIREIKEETNMDIKLLKLLFVSESVSTEYERHLINLFFLGRILNPDEKIKVNEDNRVREVKFIPVSELNDMEIHPPVASFLSRAFKEDFKGPTLFLGNLWAFSFK